MEKSDLFVGVDIGGSSVKIGVIDSNCNIISKKVIANNINLQPEHILNNILEVLKDCFNEYKNIKSIGVGVPGIVKNDILYIAPNLPNWKNLDLGGFFRSNFDCPVYIDNDAKAAAWAELKRGAGTEFNDFVYITMGTGVGGTIIINKQIYRGMHNSAGEIGHLIIDSNINRNLNSDIEQKDNYRLGVLEEAIGRFQIINIAKELLKENQNSMLYGKDFDVVDISNAADNDDPVAKNTLIIAGKYLGILLANLMNVLDITNFVIGGGISRTNNILLKTAVETAKIRAIPILGTNIILKQAKFIDETGIVGAALLGID